MWSIDKWADRLVWLTAAIFCYCVVHVSHNIYMGKTQFNLWTPSSCQYPKI